ncbi:hypothetical protein B0H13DRAFT_1921345 [Mycena leptocephala]|nr:hypothetical protein B0H13DRAFT_1921345 [Mycena leptocephala]
MALSFFATLPGRDDGHKGAKKVVLSSADLSSAIPLRPPPPLALKASSSAELITARSNLIEAIEDRRGWELENIYNPMSSLRHKWIQRYNLVFRGRGSPRRWFQKFDNKVYPDSNRKSCSSARSRWENGLVEGPSVDEPGSTVPLAGNQGAFARQFSSAQARQPSRLNKIKESTVIGEECQGHKLKNDSHWMSIISKAQVSKVGRFWEVCVTSSLAVDFVRTGSVF